MEFAVIDGIIAQIGISGEGISRGIGRVAEMHVYFFVTFFVVSIAAGWVASMFDRRRFSVGELLLFVSYWAVFAAYSRSFGGWESVLAIVAQVLR